MKQGQYQPAALIYQQAYQDCAHVFGSDHSTTLACLNNLILAFLKQGSFELAVETAQQAFERVRMVPNFESAENAMTHQVVGDICRLTGHDDLAEERFTLALAIRERIFGPRHPDVAQSLLHLGGLYAMHEPSPLETESATMEEKLLEQVEKQFREAVEIYEEALGEDNPEAAYATLQLGMLLLQKGDAGQAEVCCRQAVACFRQKLGPTHFMTG